MDQNSQSTHQAARLPGNGCRPIGWQHLASWCFVAFVVSLPLRQRIVLLERPLPPVYSEYRDFSAYWSDIFLVATLLFWWLGRRGSGRGLRFRPLGLTALIVLVTLLSGISIVYSVDRAYSSYHFIRMLFLGGLYLYLLNESLSYAKIAFAFAALIGTQSSIAILQGWLQRSTGLFVFGERLLSPATQGASVLRTEHLAWLRAYGLSDHPNLLGGSLAVGLLLLTGWLLSDPARLSWAWLWAAGVLGIGFLALLLSFSRSSWLATSVGLLLLLLCLVRARNSTAMVRLGFLLLLAFIMTIPFLPATLPFVQSRLDPALAAGAVPTESAPLSERLLLNTVAIGLIAETPWRGTGLGAFPTALRQRFDVFPIHYQPAHLTVLQVAAETGLLNGVLFLGLLILPGYLFWKERRARLPVEFLAVSAAVLGIALIGFFDYYPWMLSPGRGLQWTLWGLWGARYLQIQSSHG